VTLSGIGASFVGFFMAACVGFDRQPIP